MLYTDKIHNCNSFDELINRCDIIFKELHPVITSSMGIVQFNNLWPDNSVHGIRQIKRTFNAVKEKLEQFTDMKEIKTYYLLSQFVNLSLLKYNELELWKFTYTLGHLVSVGIKNLVNSTNTSQYSQVQSIIARLRSISTLIKGERRRVTKPVQKWNSTEIQQLNDFIQYLRQLCDEYSDIEDSIDDLNQAINFATNQLFEYIQYLTDQNNRTLSPNFEFYVERINTFQSTIQKSNDLDDLDRFYLAWCDHELDLITHFNSI